MRTLRVLGGLWLDSGGGPSAGRGAQRRRLALLTLLALSPRRRVTRDKAIATLWPENTNAEGRRRLSSAVYDLRTLLGDDAIESAGDELWIASTAPLRVDIADFEAACASGDFEAALAAYGGPLLDGVHVSGAAEFEEWIAPQRDRLRRQYLLALEQVVSARASRGDNRGAVSAAMQLVDIEPLSGHAALVAIDALISSGDRPRALTVAEAHASRVRRELGVDSDDAVLDAMRRLRSSSTVSNRLVPGLHDGGTDRERFSDGSNAPETVAPVDKLKSGPLPTTLVRWMVAATIVVTTLAGAAYRSRGSVGRESAGAVGLTSLAAEAARSTSSTAALRSFVDGEAAYKSGRYNAAKRFFLTAVATDSTFALAHYRLSATMLWQDDPTDYAVTHDSLALVWSSRLPDEEQLLVRAYLAWRRGSYESADSLDRALIRRDPANAEALYQLGELAFHYNSLRGRKPEEAEAWFNRALSVDNANWGARWHLLLLDASRVSSPEFHTRVSGLLAAQPDGQPAAELRLFAADLTELPRLASSATESMLFDAAWRRAVYRRDLTGAELLIDRMLEQGKTDFDRTPGSSAKAALLFGRGRTKEAVRALQAQFKRAAGGDSWVILAHGLLGNRDTSVDLDPLGRAIERWRHAVAGADWPSSEMRVDTRYVEGLLAAARGDSIAANRAADELDEIGRRGSPYVPDANRKPQELAHTVRAFAFSRAGRCDAALSELDAERGTYWLGVVASVAVASQGFERLIRAECLSSLGRYAESINWFATLEQGTIFDLEFLDAALRGQAAAHRALGDDEAAAAIERRRAKILGQ